MDFGWVFNYIGLIAFAISGALIAIEQGLDYYGISIAALTTALGGGVLRDVLIGNTPPMALTDPIMTLVVVISALFTVRHYHLLNKHNYILLFCDAIGLGVFTALGCSIAIQSDNASFFMVIALGLATGVGGGIIRDTIIKRVPYIFRKEIYAIASILGSVVFYVSITIGDMVLASVLCSLCTFMIRLVAIHLNLNLIVPKEQLLKDLDNELC